MIERLERKLFDKGFSPFYLNAIENNEEKTDKDMAKVMLRSFVGTTFKCEAQHVREQR